MISSGYLSMLGAAANVAHVGSSAYYAEGGPEQKFMAGVSAAGEMAAFDVGLGVAGNIARKRIGAFAATNSGKFVFGNAARRVASLGVRGGLMAGTAGALVTLGVAGGLYGGYKAVDYLAQRGAASRSPNLEWGGLSKSMTTRKAATMRQRSLAQMNRGAMSARSLMGREAQYLHR